MVARLRFSPHLFHFRLALSWQVASRLQQPFLTGFGTAVHNKAGNKSRTMGTRNDAVLNYLHWPRNLIKIDSGPPTTTIYWKWNLSADFVPSDIRFGTNCFVERRSFNFMFRKMQRREWRAKKRNTQRKGGLPRNTCEEKIVQTNGRFTEIPRHASPRENITMASWNAGSESQQSWNGHVSRAISYNLCFRCLPSFLFVIRTKKKNNNNNNRAT